MGENTRVEKDLNKEIDEMLANDTFKVLNDKEKPKAPIKTKKKSEKGKKK